MSRKKEKEKEEEKEKEKEQISQIVDKMRARLDNESVFNTKRAKRKYHITGRTAQDVMSRVQRDLVQALSNVGGGGPISRWHEKEMERERKQPTHHFFTVPYILQCWRSRKSWWPLRRQVTRAQVHRQIPRLGLPTLRKGSSSFKRSCRSAFVAQEREGPERGTLANLSFDKTNVMMRHYSA